MSLRKSVRSLLGFPDAVHRRPSISRRGRHIRSTSNGPGLRCVAGELPSQPPHVLESASIGTRLPLPPTPPPEGGIEEEAAGLGCLYGRSGGTSLELCTESLGFESCCDGRVGEEERRAEQEIIRMRIEECKRRLLGEREVDDEMSRRGRGRSSRRRTMTTEAKKEFPPPLPSLGAGCANGGRSRCFLKAVKTDGRLVLTEVRVERLEVLRASRQDGRLKLELVKSEPEQVEVEEEEEAVTEEVEQAVAATEKEEVEERMEEERWEVLQRRRWELENTGIRCQDMVRRKQYLPPSPVWSMVLDCAIIPPGFRDGFIQQRKKKNEE